MVTADHTAHSTQPAIADHPFPPIAELAIGSLALIVVGGVYVASYVPKSVSLVLPVILLGAAAILLLVNIAVMTQLQNFAWALFRRVFQWALLAYLVIAGMIGYVFVVDGTPGRTLAVLISMLVVFAIDIPLLIAFSVARYQDVD